MVARWADHMHEDDDFVMEKREQGGSRRKRIEAFKQSDEYMEQVQEVARKIDAEDYFVRIAGYCLPCHVVKDVNRISRSASRPVDRISLPAEWEDYIPDLWEDDDRQEICGMCLGSNNNARMLSCRHKFCESCISEWIIGNGKPCPMCRKPAKPVR